MYWGGRKRQRGFTLILHQQLNKEYVLGRKQALERILIGIQCDILSSLIESVRKAQTALKFNVFAFSILKLKTITSK